MPAAAAAGRQSPTLPQHGLPRVSPAIPGQRCLSLLELHRHSATPTPAPHTSRGGRGIAPSLAAPKQVHTRSPQPGRDASCFPAASRPNRQTQRRTSTALQLGAFPSPAEVLPPQPSPLPSFDKLRHCPNSLREAPVLRGSYQHPYKPVSASASRGARGMHSWHSRLAELCRI